MERIFPVLSVNLLQNNVRYFKDDDPLGAVIILVCLAGGVLIVFMLNLAKNGTGSSGLRGRGGTGSRSFSGFALHRVARYYHLNWKQTKILGEVFKANGVTDLSRIMKNPDLMDRCFKRTYKDISRNTENEAEAEQKITQLFSLRNVLDILQGEAQTISSTTQIAEHTMAVLNTSLVSYPVQVASAKGEHLVLEGPLTQQEDSSQLTKGAKETLSFTQSSQSISFDTRIMETAETAGGLKLELAHSSQIKYMSRRQFRRKQIEIQCVYYLIRIEDTKSRFKKKQKMIVSRKKLIGQITDISIGGCAIKDSGAPVGSQLKIEINQPRERGLAVLGQVLRINQNGFATVMHIKFLKVPRRTWNMINAMVFNYHDN
ncbi:MAG: PilZ domain-containing protein [Spirochaetaceae bacterium]|jgi:hypothetical protein|nr:PilZ domain-containing protein [Spirochaetaceae bacterium]